MKRLSRIPTMNLPEESGTYNIIQFYINDKPYMRFGRNLATNITGYSYLGSHEQIVHDFSDEINANAKYGNKSIGNGKSRPRNVPALPSKPEDSIDCILVGAGACKLYAPSIGVKNPITPPAEFYGNSITYNRMICSYHLFDMKDEFEENGIDLNIHNINIGQ